MPPRLLRQLAVPRLEGACHGEGLNRLHTGANLAMNLLECLRKDCPTTSLVHTWAYGYLDLLLTHYCDGRANEQHVRKQHYMLQQAVEVRLQELDKAAKAEALRKLMLRREAGNRVPPMHITER